MISDFSDAGTNYPPYNISKSDDRSYRITIAAAGFSIDEIEITHHQDRLEVKGAKADTEDMSSFLHRGISLRPFRRNFVLEENTRPVGAEFKDGLLHIDLEHVIPEEKKARTVNIRAS